MNIVVDYELREGHGQCLLAAPEVLDQPDDVGHVVVLDQEPGAATAESVVRAAAMCPAQALRVIT